MNARSDWLERQYWQDVVAVRPTTEIEQRISASCEIRETANAVLDLSYGAGDRQKLDLFLPESKGPWPLLVFIHGGYWRRGSKDEWAFLAPQWTARGVAFAAVGYRLLPSVKLVDIVADIRSAIEVLAENAAAHNLDIDRIVLSGISAGAHLAAMYITAPAAVRIKAAALLSGVYDPRPVEPTTPGADLAASLSANLEDISPIGRKTPHCPCIIAWGADETQVFGNQSRALAAHWANWGIETDMVAIPNYNHFTICKSLQADGAGPVVEFISQHLLHE